MANFLAGPAAEIVGAGMQAIGIGIPVGETSAKVINGLRDCGLPLPPKSWFKRKNGEDEERVSSRAATPSKNVYDKLEEHINGMIQVVKPAIELKTMVRKGCCKSTAERPKARVRSPSPDERKYYAPQKCPSGGCKLSNSSQKKLVKRSSKDECERGVCSRRRSARSSMDDDSCMCCSRSKLLLELPCGRLICSKCDKTMGHDLECKQCKKLTS